MPPLSNATNLSANGMRVLVTGTGAGIGRVIAETFLAHGARVHICEVDAHDIASMVLFLCSDAGRHIIGQPISVDADVRYLV